MSKIVLVEAPDEDDSSLNFHQETREFLELANNLRTQLAILDLKKHFKSILLY